MTTQAHARVAVLGSTSFSGSDFIDLLLERGGYDVLGISRSPESDPVMLAHLRHGRDHYAFQQIHVFHESDRLMKTLDAFAPDYVVNFAAQGEVGSSFAHPVNHFETNAVAVVRLTDALKDRRYLKKYVHISTPEVYGTCAENAREEELGYSPSSPYAASKAAADMFTTILNRVNGFPVSWIRSTNVYGPRQQLYRIIPRAIIYRKLGRKLRLDGGGRAIKSYINIRDVSRGELLVMESGRPGEVYHLSPDTSMSIREVVSTIYRIMGVDFDEAVEEVDDRPGQDAAYVISSQKIRTTLGWQPQIAFDDGCARVVQWVEDHWEAIANKSLQYQFQA